MKKLLIASALLTALTGCQSTSSVGNDIAQMACHFPDDLAQEHEAPQWVCDNMPNGVAIGSVGYAEESVSGLRVMKKIATNDARRSLAESFESSVKERLRDKANRKKVAKKEAGKVEVSEESSATFESIAESMSSITLTNSRVMASVRSPAGGLYVLVGMDEKAFLSNFERAEDASKRKNPELWKKFLEEKNAERMEQIDKSMSSK